MKQNKLSLLLILLMTAMTISAQKSFTLEDLNFGGNNYRNMVPKNRWTTWWGDQLIHQDVEECSLIDKSTGKEEILFTLEEINNWAKTDETSQIYHLGNATFPYGNKPLVLLNNKKERMLIDFKKRQVVWRQNAEGESFADWNPISKAVAYVS